MTLKPKEVALLVLLVNATPKQEALILPSLKGNAKKIGLAIKKTKVEAGNSIHIIAADSIKNWVKRNVREI